jgi:hypothetical protein
MTQRHCTWDCVSFVEQLSVRTDDVIVHEHLPCWYVIGLRVSTRPHDPSLCSHLTPCVFSLTGVYCPVATMTPIACGNATVYCPQGATTPLHVPVGQYSTPTNSSVSQRSGVAPCEPGFYCLPATGVRQPCDGGTANPDTALTSPCVLQCEAGYHCPPGSVSASSVATACNSSLRCCPAGAASPIDVSVGYYAVGRLSNDSTMTLFIAQTVCTAGWYCVSGLRLSCPAGYGCNTTGVSQSTLAALVCPPGTYAVAGSTACSLCPAGRYGSEFGLPSASCSGPCDVGFTCQEGSTSARMVSCPERFYCPINSTSGVAAAAIPCPEGHGCPAGSSQPQVCPAGRYEHSRCFSRSFQQFELPTA